MILIVDDKQENIFSLKTVLDQHGFNTDTALSGEEALKKLLKLDYALIILDVQMPGMDGFEVAEAITGLNKTRDIPIIFLSAVNTHKKFITKGFESGAVDYLTKPVDPEILILKVRNFYRLFEKTRALKEAEKALKEKVQELNITLESLPQIAFTASKTGNIDLVNKQWFDYAPARDIFPDTPPGHIPFGTLWHQHLSNGNPFAVEVCIQNKTDEQYYFHQLRAAPIRNNGYITRWVGTITNVHEQKLLNEELERRVADRTHELLEINRELEITNHDLQQFTFVASHDLKEPLRKIQIYGHMVKEQHQLEPATGKYLDKILQSSERMSNLITDLLSFARLSQAERFEKTDLNCIVQDILQDLEIQVEEKQATITVDPLPCIEVIPFLVRQLFQNMISNALKFSKPGLPPLVQVQADLVEALDADSPVKDDGCFCRIVISDNGIGFEEKYIDKIFSIFQRLNARDAYEGTGIGLAIAKKIVEKHNGLITARSQPDEGARFIVILPVQQLPQPC